MRIKNKYFQYVACVIALLVIIISVTDFVAYLNGGVKSSEYVTLSQPVENNLIGYFTVNNKYWGIGGDFQKHRIITATNPKNTEIRVIHTEPFLKENLCTIYYLPISKFIIKIQIPITDGNMNTENFIFYK